MIFSAKNEIGESTCDMVLDGRKIVTRRLKPQPVGAIRAVQPNRAKKGKGFIKILRCDKETWFGASLKKRDTWSRQEEASKEGFKSYSGLEDYFIFKYGTSTFTMYRIEFELVQHKKNIS